MSDASLVMVFVRLIIAVAVVIGLLIAASRVSRRYAHRATGGRPALRVIARQPLTRSASVAIVQSGNRTLVVGVTDNSVTLLTEHTAEDGVALDLATIEAEADATARERAQHARARTARAARSSSNAAAATAISDLAAMGAAVADKREGAPRTASRPGNAPGPSRMGLVDTLRDRTVRRA